MDRNYATPAVTPTQTLTSEWLDGLENLSQQLGQAQSSLSDMVTRMFGDRGADAANGPSPVANGRADSIALLITRLTAQAQELSNSASRLNSRI